MRILLLSDFALPDSCADATRVMNFAKIFKALGHETVLLGVSYKNDAPLSGECCGIAYTMLRAKPYFGIHATKRLRYLSKDIGEYLQKNPIFDVIFLSNFYYDHMDVLRKYAKTNNARLVINAVEWFDAGNPHFSGLFGKINLFKNRRALKHIYVKAGNILAISSLLDNYYQRKGCNTTTIPTIIDLHEYRGISRTSEDPTNKLRIAYAGSPGKKDYILNALYALDFLSEKELEKIEFHFYGPKKDDLYALGLSREFLTRYESNIVCHGRIPYEEVKHRISEADFTILLRPNKRYANAGFPTKVGESMACGTPVIANLTSDIGNYLRDGENGLVCENETPKACATVLQRALRLSSDELSKMRYSAFACAEEGFCYEKHLPAMQNFLKQMIQTH